ncbi:hypothetical protein ASC99_32295 [Kitasatospora sp. Root107]|nr:hypothetical protein ASC99_32295 [Kitasatospora sp. Root107]
MQAASRSAGSALLDSRLPSAGGKVAKPGGTASSAGNPKSDDTNTTRFTFAMVAALPGRTGYWSSSPRVPA